MRKLRRDIQIVFQDPYTSLNPRKTVGDIVGEPFEIHPDVVPQAAAGASGSRSCWTSSAEPGAHQPLPAPVLRWPAPAHRHRPRRRANPKVIICDEPVSALDVSVQAQVVNLMEKLQDELGLSYIFIAHDLSVVRHISDRVGVMYLGKMAELGDEDQIYARPTHPYTQALLSAVPVPDPTLREQARADRAHGRRAERRPTRRRGCRFHTRCWKAQERCTVDVPALIHRPDGVSAHLSACHFASPREIIETIDVSEVGQPTA